MPPPRPRRVVEEPGSRLFVGNLSYEIDTDQLRKFFEKWGPRMIVFCPRTDNTKTARVWVCDLPRRRGREAGCRASRRHGTRRAAAACQRGRGHAGPPQSTQPTQRASKWGTKAEDDEDEERERRYESTRDAAKPDFGLSGALAKDENTGNVYKGHVLKWTEPDDARKPVDRWRIYEYKNGEQVKILHIHRQSAFLIGRIKDIADILTMHPSCSSQHAVLQFRLKVLKDDLDEVRVILPYVMDLESTNGTFLNGERLAPARYVELREKDV